MDLGSPGAAAVITGPAAVLFAPAGEDDRNWARATPADPASTGINSARAASRFQFHFVAWNTMASLLPGKTLRAARTSPDIRPNGNRIGRTA
jgi:hypothetical protein